MQSMQKHLQCSVVSTLRGCCDSPEESYLTQWGYYLEHSYEVWFPRPAAASPRSLLEM